MKSCLHGWDDEKIYYWDGKQGYCVSDDPWLMDLFEKVCLLYFRDNIVLPRQREKRATGGSQVSYNYTHKKIKINNREHDASFPNKHSRVKGIIYEWRNLNAGDSWANIPNYSLTFYVLWKGNKTWELVTDNKYRNKYWSEMGLNKLLRDMEDDRTKERLFRNERLEYLKSTIRDCQKELEMLEQGK